MLDNKIVCCAATADAGAPLQKVIDDPKEEMTFAAWLASLSAAGISSGIASSVSANPWEAGNLVDCKNR